MVSEQMEHIVHQLASESHIDEKKILQSDIEHYRNIGKQSRPVVKLVPHPMAEPAARPANDKKANVEEQPHIKPREH